MESEISALKEKNNQDKKAIDLLINDGENSIEELNKRISVQSQEMSELHAENKKLKSKIQEKIDIIQSNMDENQGLKQAVETMKNTIEQMRQRGHCDKYYNLNLNSSIENNKSLQYELECEGYLNRNTSIINKTIPSTQYNQQTQHQDFDLNETTSDDFFINSRKYGDAAHQHEEDTPRYDAAEEQDGHAAAQEQNGQAVAQEQDGHVAAHEHDGHVATHEQDGHVMAHEWDGHVVAHERDRHVTAYEQEAYVTDSCSTLSNTLAQLQEQLDNIQKQLKGLQKSITPQEIKTASAQIPNVTQGKNINIFTVGDSHVRDLKTIMESKLPKNLSVDHSFIPGGRFHDISSKCIKKYENCDHLIVMAGTNDIGKTSFKEIKTHIENIIIKFKDSKIHLVLVPDRFDKVTMNLDIKILNDKIKTLVKDYKNITIYHTTSIVDSWDYCDNIHFGPNGKEKLSNAICKEILSTMHHQNLSSTNKRKFTKSKSNVFRREVNYYSKPNDHRNAHSNKEYYSSEHHKYSSTKPNKRKSNQSFCGQEEYFYSNPNYQPKNYNLKNNYQYHFSNPNYHKGTYSNKVYYNSALQFPPLRAPPLGNSSLPYGNQYSNGYNHRHCF
ncbi:uncharacterized protein LOC113469008 [Diaphorina citri]|uniref:Uncharacterized protein LOC113469008 n=1 Tax=Diaphorina citri TaxID=121845 RepID=A0A3Q0J5I1_DIACI|nr:uncharacterized protein LOC113469008 [Diaphorina citri]